MCILCVVQKWSRRVATMLPWLVIPLIGFWALSQLLPPGFRFEVTSPRLACVLVLLVTLFWYEVLMPQLSVWRTRRSARLRERQRFEALELQKLRKTATRRCRNCHTPYRDQNPGGGRFMCSYCGHISKRPVLDIDPAMLGIANSGIGKIWNGKVWSENGWICGNDWSENGNWAAPPSGGKSNYLGKNGSAFSSGGGHGDDSCSAEKSYSGGVVYFCNLLSNFFLSISWLWRKIFWVSSVHSDGSLDAENKGMLSKKGENGINYHESRGEKARRKAEEKRQARLEKELLEEEERKQREEVARLVEERRRLRDEQLEAQKQFFKRSTPDGERGNRREAERTRRLEKKKDKDRGSSKSNSDGEDLERKSNRESERKREFERRDVQKTTGESIRAPSSDMGHAIKSTMNSVNRVSGGGSRYFDRMKGSLLSSSKAFNGAGFFGRAAHSSATANTKVNKPTGFGDHGANRRDVHSAEHISTGKFTTTGDDKTSQTSSHRQVGSDLQPCPPVQKKSWQQLFTRSSTTLSPVANDFICQQSQSHQSEAQSSPLPDTSPLSYQFDNQMHFGLPLPHSNSPLFTGSMKSSSVSPPVAESTFSLVGGLTNDFISEEAELFEDPCYVPDPVSLLGPVSESLDNFPLDLGTGFLTGRGLERPHVFKKLSAAADVNRPAPIESPFSRSRVAEERHAKSGQSHSALKSLPVDGSGNVPEHGTWQMWGTPPLGQDGLGLSGGSTNWILPIVQNKTNGVEILHPSSQEAMVSHYSTENLASRGTYSPQNAHVSSFHNGGSFSPPGPASSDYSLWPQKTVFQPLSGDEENSFPPLNSQKDLSQNEVTCDNPSNSAAFHLFEQSPANCWSKRDWAVSGEGEHSVGDSSTLAMPHVGLFSTSDVQSLWSFN
ncbi:hypothetical protein MRB53_026354 [Persea americana]|uniref:Uncharacterized protein n=1 Tax=Persea americana TaxID=3435 RepID=A0ACC2LIK9_PERAE|nr:hypothetical protein MRB53_026354 [Persea americana]